MRNERYRPPYAPSLMEADYRALVGLHKAGSVTAASDDARVPSHICLCRLSSLPVKTPIR